MNGVDKNPVGFASRVAFFLLFLTFGLSYASLEPHLGSARVVFQTNYGDIEFGFFREIAPKTVDHIFKLVRLGCYNTNHFFRVDKGFVAQVADVSQGRSAPMNEEQIFEAKKTVVGEFSKVKHVRGTLSMGRYSDPDSGSSSFSILLGDAPHLDEQYTIFGWVTKGEDTLKKLEELPTRREGIFVMPTERITILSTYFYDVKEESCEWEKTVLKRKLAESAIEVERQEGFELQKLVLGNSVVLMQVLLLNEFQFLQPKDCLFGSFHILILSQTEYSIAHRRIIGFCFLDCLFHFFPLWMLNSGNPSPLPLSPMQPRTSIFILNQFQSLQSLQFYDIIGTVKHV